MGAGQYLLTVKISRRIIEDSLISSLWIFTVWERVAGQYEICGRDIRKQLYHYRRKDSNQPDEEIMEQLMRHMGEA